MSVKKNDFNNGRDPLASRLKHCDRRTFLKTCGALGLGAAGAVAGTTGLPAVFEAVRIDRRRFAATQTHLRMGTSVTFTAVHDSKAQAEAAIGRALEEMDRLIAIFSRHDTSTPLSVLNRDGTLAGPPPELVDMLAEAQRYYNDTGGTFDVTVKPLLDLMAATVGAGRNAPAAEAIDAALSCVGIDGLDVSARRVRFQKAGMGITLDGVAKGYIVDRASDALVRHGVDHHLINAGGDIRARGGRSSGRPWRIAVRDPRQGGRYLDVIELVDGAVATSGDYEIYYDEERMYHHVVDPRTGRSPVYDTSASVMAATVMRADALSTALFVSEPREGIRLIDGQRGTECMVLTRGGERFESRGWSARRA